MNEICRKGNDLSVKVIVMKGKEKAVLSKDNVKVEIKSTFGRPVPFAYTIAGNVISGTFFGRNQSSGSYIVVLTINGESMKTMDAKLVRIVDSSNKGGVVSKAEVTFDIA